MDRLDIRKELESMVVLLIGGRPVAPQSPAATDVGGVSFSTLRARDDILQDARARGLFR